MSDLQRQLAAQEDRLFREAEILRDMMEALSDECDHDSASLAVAQAKRVRTAVTLLVKTLAQTRDNLQP